MSSPRIFLLSALTLALSACTPDAASTAGDESLTEGKADDPTGDAPLATKSSGTGFTAEAWVRNESCQLFADRVVITRQYGSVTTEQTVALSVSEEIGELIASLENEPMTETDNFLCDGPSTYITVGDDTLVYSTGGCGNPKLVREGAGSSALRDMLALHCPQTY